MKAALKNSDYYETPADVFEELDREFNFEWDACANESNTKVLGCYFDEEQDALRQDWHRTARVFFCNPPYSKEGNKDAFIGKAWEEAQKGCTVVLLLPAKVNTIAFHTYIWDREKHRPRPNVEVRFPKGRISFGLNGAPSKGSGRFESMIVVFRPPQEGK